MLLDPMYSLLDLVLDVPHVGVALIVVGAGLAVLYIGG
jgi:hypothetical protein